jgi:dihydropteroate synthase
MKSYLRPLSLLFGPDARRAIEERWGCTLGGSRLIAFSKIEISERGDDGQSAPRVISYSEPLPSVEARRPPLCGLALDRPRIMGVINVTPDSFSDGGELAGAGAAIAHGEKLREEGADFLDVGGESTRPGSDPVSTEEEWRRIGPVISGLARAGHAVSVDTRKPEIMRRAAEAGALVINDVSALTYAAESLPTAAALGLPVILMHAKGDPKTMQVDPSYDDVVHDVFDALEGRIAACEAIGIARERLVIDPGIGFGKTVQHNLELLHRLTLFHALGVPLAIGMSRKSTIGALTGEKMASERVMGSLGAAVYAALVGAQILRVHDVKATKQALRVALAFADPDHAV